MASRTPLRRLLAGVVVAAAVMTAALGGANAASAHDSLVSSSPAEGDTVAALSEVRLDFSANLLGADGGNIVIVVGPDGRHYESACAELAGSTLTLPVALGDPGEYSVEWRAVSSDGHPVSGVIAFTSTGASTSDGTEGSVCEGAAGATEAPEASAPSAETGPPPGLVIGLVAGGGVLALVAVLIVVIVRTRPRED